MISADNTNSDHDIQLKFPNTDGSTCPGEQGERRAEDEEDSTQHTQQKVCRGEIVSLHISQNFIQKIILPNIWPPMVRHGIFQKNYTT